MGVSDCRKSAYSVADIPGFFKFKFTNCRSLGGSDSSDIYRIRHIYESGRDLRSETFLNSANDEIDWKKTTFLALITSVDAFLAGIGMGFLEAQMIHQSLTIFPITVLSVIGGVYVGYRLGTVHNSQAYLAGGALFLIAGVDVVIQYCMY